MSCRNVDNCKISLGEITLRNYEIHPNKRGYVLN